MRWFVGFAAIQFLFYWIRFYVPLLMVGAMGLWLAMAMARPTEVYLLPLIVVAVNLPLPACANIPS